MKVRDLRYPKKEYLGKEVEAGAGGKNCPCLSCWRIHNFTYKHWSKYIDNYDCVTKHLSGCPDRLPEPIHIFELTKRFEKRKIGDKFKCIRCGQKIAIGNMTQFITVVPNKKEIK